METRKEQTEETGSWKTLQRGCHGSQVTPWQSCACLKWKSSQTSSRLPSLPPSTPLEPIANAKLQHLKWQHLRWWKWQHLNISWGAKVKVSANPQPTSLSIHILHPCSVIPLTPTPGPYSNYAVAAWTSNLPSTIKKLQVESRDKTTHLSKSVNKRSKVEKKGGISLHLISFYVSRSSLVLPSTSSHRCLQTELEDEHHVGW